MEVEDDDDDSLAAASSPRVARGGIGVPGEWGGRERASEHGRLQQARARAPPPACLIYCARSPASLPQSTATPSAARYLSLAVPAQSGMHSQSCTPSLRTPLLLRTIAVNFCSYLEEPPPPAAPTASCCIVSRRSSRGIISFSSSSS